MGDVNTKHECANGDGGLLRLVIPQWQGGESRAYPLGAKLLNWLAPKTLCETVEISVPEFSEDPQESGGGIAGVDQILAQMRAVRDVLSHRQPSKLVVFGGDCQVTQEPFSYLRDRYGEKIGLVWFDTHPDVASSRQRSRAHTMVLGHLLGQGENALSERVAAPFDPAKVLMVGLGELFSYEAKALDEFGVARINQSDLPTLKDAIFSWLDSENISTIAIHLDLDVLAPTVFRAQGFSLPGQNPTDMNMGRTGAMDFKQLLDAISMLSERCNIVGLGITEHLPWDMLNLQDTLSQIPILQE